MRFPWSKRSSDELINKPEKVDKYVDRNYIESNSYLMHRLIAQLRDLSQTRDYKYAEYDIMAADVIIKAALNMYADDSTQQDKSSGEIFSVTSKDDTLRKDLNVFLEKMNINELVRNAAYHMAKYGNKYWKVYLTENGTDIDHLEEVVNPGRILDLAYEGKPIYFAESDEDDNQLLNTAELTLYDHNAFIHFYIHSAENNEYLQLTDNTHLDKDGQPEVLTYKIIEGESLLEGVRAIWRILRSLEDSLLAARLAKADYIRIFNIEVADSSTTDTRLIVNKVKKLFDSTVSMNIRDGEYNAVKQPRAWTDPIFNSVSHGKGSININTIGGDFEVKSIVDIDYFSNLLFAGLHIPPQLLGISDNGMNSLMDNGKTMEQLDIRYGRFIQKLIQALIDGVTELCNYWLRLHHRDNQIGKFDIVYAAPSEAEELEKLQQISERVDIVSRLSDTIVNSSDGINKVKLMNELLNEFVPYPDFLNRIKPILDDAVKDSDLATQLEKKKKEVELEQLKNPPDNGFNDLLSGLDDESSGDEEPDNDNGLDTSLPEDDEEFDLNLDKDPNDPDGIRELSDSFKHFNRR